ncbi:hypothetical protein ACHAXS_005371 [Conticribra weissflogii]
MRIFNPSGRASRKCNQIHQHQTSISCILDSKALGQPQKTKKTGILVKGHSVTEQGRANKS